MSISKSSRYFSLDSLSPSVFIFTFIISCIYINDVNAASATISVSANKSTVVVGETVTITYTLSSSTAIQGWDFTASYDSSYFSFVSSNMEGSTQAVNVATNSSTKSKKYTLKKAKSRQLNFNKDFKNGRT